MQNEQNNWSEWEALFNQGEKLAREKEIKKRRAEGGKKGGRPKINDEKKIRNETISLRLSNEEKAQILEKASRANMSISDFIRQACISSEVVERRTPDPELMKILAEYRIHFVNIRNFFKSRIWDEADRAEFKSDLRNIIDKMNNLIMKL